MVLETEAKIIQSKNARTQYIVIPADMVADSQYLFKANERIRITIDPYRKIMIVRSFEDPAVEISPKGIYIRGKKIEVVEE
ncbi:MAG: hypothetical protein QXV37_02720 [Candidatus Jordarchaeaceae archaeon]